MRKPICFVAALCVTGAAGAYLAACHAAKHPECFLARCANLAGYVGARCSPLLAFGEVNQRAAKPVARCAPAPVLEEQSNVGSIESLPEPIEPILVEAIDPGVAPEKLRPEALPPPETEEPRVLFSEPRVPFMPYADTANREVVSCNAVSATQALVDTCWTWLSSHLGGCGSEQNVCPANCFIRMSAEPFREFVKALHEETAKEIETQIDQNQKNDAPPSAPVPEVPPGLFPQLQVDPHHHHHYPSCPYTGRTPSCFPSNRSVQPLETPRSVPVSPVPRNEVMPEMSAIFSFWLGLFP